MEQLVEGLSLKQLLRMTMALTSGPREAAVLLAEATVAQLEAKMGKKLPEGTRESVQETILKSIGAGMALMREASEMAGKPSGVISERSESPSLPE